MSVRMYPCLSLRAEEKLKFHRVLFLSTESVLMIKPANRLVSLREKLCVCPCAGSPPLCTFNSSDWRCSAVGIPSIVAWSLWSGPAQFRDPIVFAGLQFGDGQQLVSCPSASQSCPASHHRYCTNPIHFYTSMDGRRKPPNRLSSC